MVLLLHQKKQNKNKTKPQTLCRNSFTTYCNVENQTPETTFMGYIFFSSTILLFWLYSLSSLPLRLPVFTLFCPSLFCAGSFAYSFQLSIPANLSPLPHKPFIHLLSVSRPSKWFMRNAWWCGVALRHVVPAAGIFSFFLISGERAAAWHSQLWFLVAGCWWPRRASRETPHSVTCSQRCRSRSSSVHPPSEGEEEIITTSLFSRCQLCHKGATCQHWYIQGIKAF